MGYQGITGYTTSDLEKMQRTVIGQAKFTREHKGCMVGLSERFDLEQGQSTLTIPKLSSFDDAQDLQDGVDMTQAQQIANSYTDITTAEIGIKGIITDKLIRQMNESVWRMMGRLLGDSMKRKIEKDGLDLLDGFSNALGAYNTTFTTGHLTAAITQLLGQSEPAPEPFAYVGHPYQVKLLMDSVAKVGTYPLPEGFSAQMVKDYWRGTLDMFGVPIFSNGLITVASNTSAKGAVFSKSALGYVVSKEGYTERQRDASLRAWELVHVQDSDWVELDDAYGMEMFFACATPTS
jgi:hypothetical protein